MVLADSPAPHPKVSRETALRQGVVSEKPQRPLPLTSSLLALAIAPALQLIREIDY